MRASGEADPRGEVTQGRTETGRELQEGRVFSRAGWFCQGLPETESRENATGSRRAVRLKSNSQGYKQVGFRESNRQQRHFYCCF